MREVVLNSIDLSALLDSSIQNLGRVTPEASAKRLVARRQLIELGGLGILFALGLLLFAKGTAIAVFAVVTALYVVATAYRVFLHARSTSGIALHRITDHESRALCDKDLPFYTILVPAYHEANIIEQLVRHLGNLEYPAERLDIKFLVEADDEETISALHSSVTGPQFELVLIPSAAPRTKPKALNFGLALARGEFVTIFDAEDEPEPLQLRRAVVAFSRVKPEVACLQARLAYSNPMQNLITRWFAIEYATWFSMYLPGLASLSAPVPLGGTSNHFRRAALESVGAWDPFNVTEDADLGLRLFRRGFRVEILHSETLEEANSDFVNWVRQRSRWYKGYAQTFIVHFRSPRRLITEIGLLNAVQFGLFVGGTPALALVNPVFWLMTAVWFIAHPAFIIETFPAPVYYAGLCCWALGNFVMVYLAVICVRTMRKPELLWAAMCVPLYWVMMSLAAVKAALQLIATPSLWEKTVHGLLDPKESSASATDPLEHREVTTSGIPTEPIAFP